MSLSAVKNMSQMAVRTAETAAEAAAQVRGKESGAGERLRRNLASGKKNEESAK